MRRVVRAIARWFVSRHTLHEAMTELDKELAATHRERLRVSVDVARAERRIRELETQNLRLIRFNDFQAWESEVRKPSP